jgi:thiol:disulfide interchange protein
MLARILRLASIAICLIAIASFGAFALDQTKSASSHQRAKVDEAAPGGATTAESSKSKTGKKSDLREAVDEAFSRLSSPFSGITSGSSSRWTIQIVDTLLVLFVYGFGLSFLARLLPGRLP